VQFEIATPAMAVFHEQMACMKLRPCWRPSADGLWGRLGSPEVDSMIAHSSAGVDGQRQTLDAVN
jgi:hypothetical protein